MWLFKQAGFGEVNASPLLKCRINIVYLYYIKIYLSGRRL
jgi:hypothetical protein